MCVEDLSPNKNLIQIFQAPIFYTFMDPWFGSAFILSCARADLYGSLVLNNYHSVPQL